MTRMRVLFLWLLCCVPAVAFAGVQQGRGIPTLGEVGLLVLGAGLVGGGAFVLRRRQR
ncbi:MAG TPA: IPTL-CTERM sorting domain-containing protein [Thermoanaerobaculaceae bacterium]|nr:IPTL-CTERM sorting domain-containing protein [Thermoanaerobaculaceae bacterium]